MHEILCEAQNEGVCFMEFLDTEGDNEKML